MDKFQSYYDAIDETINLLKMDLVGPISTNEIFENELPLNVYAMGILWPKRNDELSVDEFEDSETVEDFKEMADESIRNANKYKPSSMAISAVVPHFAESINVSFLYAIYHHSRKENDTIINYYQREEKREEAIIKITKSENDIIIADGLSNPDVSIQCHIRKKLKYGVLITISVANNRKALRRNIDQNEGALFQCKLKLFSDVGFMPMNMSVNQNANDEERINNMLYSHILNYAYGHGCSVKYNIGEKVVEIESECVPQQRIKLMMPSSVNTSDILSMKYWQVVNRTEAIDRLRSFIEEYARWYDEQKRNSQEYTEYENEAKYNLQNVQRCIDRLNKAVEVLHNNDNAWKAFLLTNEAMMLQRVKTKQCSEDVVKWYPFQLAYVLQILPDIADSKSEWRNCVDLLWFPTGGGKTEAYLGVCAFTIFYRRLVHNEIKQDGVTIFMRYTLRLLTIQQFERATALICACEYLRKKYNINGGEINIGLWIGSGMTPNHLRGEGGAEEKINLILNDGEARVKESNPVQITSCPWCGERIDVHSYYIDSKMTIKCPNTKCRFNKRLPIYLIDDDIYSQRPTLVLSTIDKFARIVWEENAKNLFCPNDVPSPDLIVQDELHLISGPLGSLTGAYETMVDILCGHGNKQPKIISSTATVCHAKEQIKALYNREMFQFPPSGINARDSFFAKEATEADRPARTYIGLCETGGSLSDLLIRVYAVLFFAREYFKKKKYPSNVIDQYSTIVGYFNAIKDLGTSSNILDDRVSAYLKMLVRNRFKALAEAAELDMKDFPKYFKADELTSRRSSQEIKNTLEKLSLTYTDERCYSHIFSSNMLSVGIDIDRLGVMTMYNQPKTNSEYIQATSRVGRSNPGLVIDLYNNQRARDKSFYETFSYYHKTFYKYVEATSVTPFSSRSIEKTIQGIFIGLVRHLISGLNSNDSASLFRADLEGVAQIKDEIAYRIEQIYPIAKSYAEECLDAVADEWQSIAEDYGDKLVYYQQDKPSLLNSEEDSEIAQRFALILNSLRNVEPLCNVYISNHTR